jgi:hypothetical protein
MQRCTVARWPKFRPKGSKGRGKKNLAGRIRGQILADYYLKWQKRGQRKFSKEVPYFIIMTNTQGQRHKFNFHFSLTLRLNAGLMVGWMLGLCFCEIGRTFFDLLAGKQFFLDLAKLLRCGSMVEEHNLPDHAFDHRLTVKRYGLVLYNSRRLWHNCEDCYRRLLQFVRGMFWALSSVVVVVSLHRGLIYL